MSDLKNNVMRRRVSRRSILAASGAAGLGAAGLALVGCGDDDDDDETVSQAIAQVIEEEAEPVEQVAADDGFTPATADRVPPRSAKDQAILAIAATPLAADPDFGHGSPQTWESWMNVHDQPLKFGWAEYPFDVGAVENVGYVSFKDEDILPWMHESFPELSEDGTSATHRIKPGVLSSTGNELTADDFAWRIDRAFALGAIGAFFMNLLTVDPANPYEIIDKYTIKVNSTAPNGLLAPIWANSAWQPLDSVEAKKNTTADDEWAIDWMAQSAVGFGGIKINSFGTGERVVYGANPNYFRGEPPIKEIIYDEIPSASNRLAAVAAGEADAAYGLPGELFAQAQEEEIQNPIAIKGNFIWFAFMNSLRDPFRDPRTRQAMNWATPRQDILDTTFGGLGNAWTTVMTSIWEGICFDCAPWGVEPDFAEAKKLLDAAGQADGFDVTMDTNSSRAQDERMAVLMQDAFLNINVNMSISPQPEGPFIAEGTGKQKVMAFWQDAYIQPDPIYFLALGYDAGLSGINNYGQLDDPLLNDLIAQASAKLTSPERAEIAVPIQERVVELSPYIWLVEPFYVNVINENLRGWRWHTTQETYWSDMYFV